MPEEFNSPFNPLNDDECMSCLRNIILKVNVRTRIVFSCLDDDFWTLQFGDTEPTDDAGLLFHSSENINVVNSLKYTFPRYSHGHFIRSPIRRTD